LPYSLLINAMPHPKLLRRSPRDRIFAGVCSGISVWLGWNVTLVRLLFVIGSFVPIIPGFLVYLVLWAVIPMAPE
jgi:phage shock protein C